MASTQKQTVKTIASYWKVFRLVFVFFFLYLVKDTFYRWDGFRYYASFTEFLPSIALVTIPWTIVALFTTMLIWLPFRVFGWFCHRVGWKIRAEHLLMFTGIFVFSGVVVWRGKLSIWPYVEITIQIKLLVFLSVALAAVFLTWLFHNKSERWIGIIQERITPLVWLFGIWVILSVPLVAYHTWIKQEDNVVISQKIPNASSADKSRPNIILVTFDALTARDMSVYGYHRPTTPFISKWTKTASLFTKVEAESNFTTPTTASLMTGKRLWTHQTYHQRGSKPVRSAIESLPSLMKNNGYYNMAFIANDAASVRILGISTGFEIAPLASEFSTPASLLNLRFGIVNILFYRLFSNKIRLHDWFIKDNFFLNKYLNRFSGDISETTIPVEKAFNRFLSVIDDNPPEPYFAWIHLFPPHYPYLAPETYMGMFDSSSEQRTFKSQSRELNKISKYRILKSQIIGKGRLSENQHFIQEVQPAVNTFRARYDEFIRYCDIQFENFLAQLTTRNKLKNTVIILSSDHGQSFEHNFIGHRGLHLYEQITHIPLIIKEPDQTEERIIDNLVEQIDIPVTILDLAGISVPSWMEGRSLVPFLRGEKLPSTPIFSMNFEENPSLGHQITKGTIAVWKGNYKLIHYLKKNKSLLFNLKQDPDELRNLFAKEPEVGQHLLTLIQNNLKKANERIKKGN